MDWSMTVLWICGEFAQEPGVLIISNPIKCERGGNGSTYGRAFWLASGPGLPFFFEIIYVLERGHGHFDLPSALPAEVGDVVPPTHQLEARQERRKVHGGKSYHSLWLCGRRIRSTRTLVSIVFRNAKTQPLKYVLEVDPRSRTILSSGGILSGLPQLCSAKNVPAEPWKLRPGRGIGRRITVYTQYSGYTGNLFLKQKSDSWTSMCKKQEIKVFGYNRLATLQTTAATTNSKWRKQLKISFSTKIQPLKHCQNKTREYGWTKPCKMINGEKEDAKARKSIGIYL